MYDINKLQRLASIFNVEVSLWGEDQDKLQMIGTNGNINKFFEEAKRQGLLDKDPFDESYDPEETSWIDDLIDTLRTYPRNDEIENDAFLKELRELYYKHYPNSDKRIEEDTLMEKFDFDALYKKIKYQEDMPIKEGLIGTLLFDTKFAHDLYTEFYQPLIVAIKSGRKAEAQQFYDECVRDFSELEGKRYAKTFLAVQKDLLAKYKEQIDAMEDVKVEEPVIIESIEPPIEEGYKPHTKRLLKLIGSDKLDESTDEDSFDEYDDYEESYTPISEDVDDDFEVPSYKAENTEFVMTEYISDSLGVESVTKVNDTTYKVVYDGTEVEIVFDFGWDEWVYNINGKGPFAHSSYEWIVSDIRNIIDDEPIKESYFEDEPSWLDDEDPVDADREHANLYGGDRTYCDNCGSKLAIDEWGGYCPKCNPPELEEGFDTHSNIDLDMVGVRVANLLDVEALGEDKWIEFDCQDSRKLIGTPDLHMAFEAIGANKMLRGYMRAHTDGTIDIYLKNGSEGSTFRNPEEIARFIAGEFGLSI